MQDDTGGSAAGAVYILFLNANGTLKDFQKIADGVGGGPNLGANDVFGGGLEALGDLNGDGVPDLAARSSEAAAGSNTGAFYVLLLKGGVGEPNPGEVLGTPIKIANGQGGFVGPQVGLRLCERDFALLGSSMAICAWSWPSATTSGATRDSGCGFCLDPEPLKFDRRGDPNPGEVCGELELNATSVPALAAELGTSDNFGLDLAALGDIDGDGTPDMAVNATFDIDGGTDRGAVYLLYPNPDKTVSRVEKISSTRGGFSGVLDDGDWFGWGLALLGDLSGDGTPELAVGARLDDDGGSRPRCRLHPVA